jgi:hypothetical protein
MFLPRQEAAKRAVARFLGPTARLVPPEVILGNTGNEKSFDAVKELADAWSFRDNNVGRNQQPKLLSERTAQMPVKPDQMDDMDSRPPPTKVIKNPFLDKLVADHQAGAEGRSKAATTATTDRPAKPKKRSIPPRE